jgi:hypothetical protein
MNYYIVKDLKSKKYLVNENFELSKNINHAWIHYNKIEARWFIKDAFHYNPKIKKKDFKFKIVKVKLKECK